MKVSRDMKQMFISKVNLIVGDIDDKVQSLTIDSNQPHLFTEIAQDLEALKQLGTIINYQEFTKYSILLQKLCTLVTLIDNDLANKKAHGIIIGFLESVGMMFKALIETGGIAMIDTKIKSATQKVDIFERQFFPKVEDQSTVG